MRTNQAKERRRAHGGPGVAQGETAVKLGSEPRPPMEPKVRPVRSAHSGPLPPDPAPPLSTELHFGILLRRARERRGLSQQDVVRTTRIAERWIPALEEARLDLLPAPVFVAGYVRSYARMLGLDEADLVDRYQALTQHRAQAALGAFIEPSLAPPSRFRSHRLLWAGCSAGLVLSLGLILYLLLR